MRTNTLSELDHVINVMWEIEDVMTPGTESDNAVRAAIKELQNAWNVVKREYEAKGYDTTIYPVRNSRKPVKSGVKGYPEDYIPDRIFYIVVNGSKEYFMNENKARSVKYDLSFESDKVYGPYEETDPEEIAEVIDAGIIRSSYKPVKSARERKYNYYKVLQGNYGYGWDDLVSYDTSDPQQMKELKDDYKAYRENEGVPLRIITRKEMIKTEEVTNSKKPVIKSSVTIEVDDDTFRDMLWERINDRDYAQRYPDWLWDGIFDDLQETGWLSPEYNTPSYIVDNIAINGEIVATNEAESNYDTNGLSAEEWADENGYRIITDPDSEESYIIVNYGL